MEFSLDHLDIVQGPKTSKSNQALPLPDYSQMTNGQNSSIVLDDLSQQIEDLQSKLKLNYRKLLLFETENEKLIQEKNKFYFDAKNSEEKLEILSEKNECLENFNSEIETKYKLVNEKYLAFEKLCQTQSVDLKRLSKFHLKIKDIIKPYVQSLKSQITTLEIDLEKALHMSQTFEKLNTENIVHIQQLKQNIDVQYNKFETEKTNFIQSYEEQIHFLSKEILHNQQKNETLQSEVFKLKKMNENKNFFENELIKFKRSQELDQTIISDLKLKAIYLENTISLIKTETCDLKNNFHAIETENHHLTQNLDSTRQQLTQKICELEKMQLRLKMLEKLNTNLSLSFTTQSCEELQIKS